ncbi:hypothetical protein DMB66_04175 [Actinoplanes sp. ATCC 53533]|uniref:hypothetical protein n=1 Tax=Actinoplanes sp. ATCC 53533 TaxID=1288362 RepID=UPI000F796A7B|nr:hypothetical protein [Actinoplanes sp. ATCC 53533]RSM73225.1 hypothetical protein DMB66_04175 [Actinoplanes sp. ATCC 53533]
MDLWDMTKLLFRRWYFSLPMLLVTLALVAVASVTVEPDYSAKGHIQLIPPAGTTASDGEKNPIKNPWFDLGYEALGNATMIDVNKKSVLEQMVADGLTDNITVTMEQVPLFEIEAVGTSSAQATASVQRVMDAIAAAVQERQQTLRVAKTETITTLKLDDGSEVEVKNSKTMRVMVVAAGLGLLLTAGFTIGLDALLRFRASRRRGDDDDGAGDGPAIGSVHPEKRDEAAPPKASFESTQVVTPHRPGGRGERANGAPEQPAARQGNGAPQRSRASDGTEYRSKQVPTIEPEQAPIDATIVLPITPTRWKRDEKADYH